MSSRHYRKKVGNTSLPPPEDDSENEYQPLYTKKKTQSTFEGLAVSSPSDSDEDSPDKAEVEVEVQQAVAAALPRANGTRKKNSKNPKKKGKGKWRQPTPEMDEVDLSLSQVNFLLGPPTTAATPEVQPKKESVSVAILHVEPKHLNVSNELRRLLGPEEHEPGRRPARVQPNRALLLKRVVVHPNKDTDMFEFNNTGLSMTKYKEANGKMYFHFNHNEKYQKMHRKFLTRYASACRSGNVSTIMTYFGEAGENMHVEALLEISDLWFEIEDEFDGAVRVAKDIVENVVTFLQYVAHPSFILTNSNVRLKYKFLENRVFHVALLKYVYLLTNKACHRTALEITKLMLTIDPKDPLAVLSIMDTIAIRAREFEWLIEIIEYYNEKRDALLLFNLRYSYALAQFHVANKKKQNLNEANKQMQEAIVAHPAIFIGILKAASVYVPHITNHEIFKEDPVRPGTPGVKELHSIYVKMNWPRWREPKVMDWALKNATEIIEKFNNDPEVRDHADGYRRWRIDDFQVLPVEYLRHIAVLSRMSKLILDTKLTAFNRPRCGWDPIFDEGINRYDYKYHEPAPRNIGISQTSAVYSYDIRNELDVALAHYATFPHTLPQFMEVAQYHLDQLSAAIPGPPEPDEFDEFPLEVLRSYLPAPPSPPPTPPPPPAAQGDGAAPYEDDCSDDDDGTDDDDDYDEDNNAAKFKGDGVAIDKDDVAAAGSDVGLAVDDGDSAINNDQDGAVNDDQGGAVNEDNDGPVNDENDGAIGDDDNESDSDDGSDDDGDDCNGAVATVAGVANDTDGATTAKAATEVKPKYVTTFADYDYAFEHGDLGDDDYEERYANYDFEDDYDHYEPEYEREVQGAFDYLAKMNLDRPLGHPKNSDGHK